MKKLTIAAVLITIILFMCTACSSTFNAGNVDEQSTPTATVPVQIYIPPTTDGHPWKGNGIIYTNESLDFAIEFPPEWEGMFMIYEHNIDENGADFAQFGAISSIRGFDMVLNPLPVKPDDYDDNSDGFLQGHIGWFGVIDNQDKDAFLSSDFMKAAPCTIVYDNDIVLVFATGHAVQTWFPEDNERFNAIFNGIMSGEFEIHIK